MGDWRLQHERAEVGAYTTTSRDCAEGAYIIIHDDMGAMYLDGSVLPAVEVAKSYPRIRVGWGVKVDVMDDEEWRAARAMVMDGHEIVNHSWDHSSAADQWQWFYPEDTIKSNIEILPKEIVGLVVGNSGAAYPKKIIATNSYIDYEQGDPTQPITVYDKKEYYVSADYSFDSTIVEKEGGDGSTWEEVKYHATGTIKPVHMGGNDEMAIVPDVLKVFTSSGWAKQPNRFKANTVAAKQEIDTQVYNQVNSLRFPKGKETEYFVYPADAFSHSTHDLLLETGHIAARGGSKGAIPTGGDFYQPFHIDFDGFYMYDTEATTVFPENPHQYVGLQALVDRLVKTKGYMVRQFHGCEKENLWNTNTWQEEASWFGGITKSLYETHFAYLDELIEANSLTVYTPTEAVKYRLTANSAKSASFDEQSKILTVVTDDVAPEYQDEISVIVKFSTAYNEMAATYADGSVPRYAPVKMDDEGKAWSISINPFTDRADNKGTISLRPNMSQVSLTSGENGAISPISFGGVIDNKLSLNLTPNEQFTASIFSASGRKVSSVNLIGSAGVTETELSTAQLGAGMFILSVEKEGVSVMKQKFMIE